MDSNNVISYTLDMNKLDKDLYDWSSLTHKQRKESDDECIKLYGCTNRELYNNLKSHILFNKPLENEALLQSNNSINIEESFDYSSIDRKDLIMKIGNAKTLNNDPLISIIYPYDPELINDESYKNKYREEFLYLYNKFIRFNDKYQKLSNWYSIQLFGYNVRCMYSLIYPDIIDTNSDNDILYSRDYVDSSESAVEDSITESLIDKNIINLFKFKIFNCTDSNSRALTEGVYSNLLISEVNQYIYTDNVENALNSVVPYFTLKEFDYICKDMGDEVKTYNNIDFSSIENGNEYFKIISELYNKFKYSNFKDTLIENTLLSLAWNPYVDPRKYMGKVRERQIKYFKENNCRVIDISKYNNITNIENLNESTKQMRDMYKKLDLYPVYIIMTYTNTLFSKIIRTAKKSQYTHTGLSLDSDMSNILTFMFDNPKSKGYSVESLEHYLKIWNDTNIDIVCLFVDGDTKKKLNDVLQYFITNKNKTSYNFKNLLNILINKAKDNDPENLSMVCSQFVDTILKLVGIDITGKSSNLVIPQDFANIKNPKVFKVYEGLARDYKEINIEGMIYDLLIRYNIEDIKYVDFVNRIQELMSNFIYHRYNIIDNDNANSILQEFYNYISIEPVIYCTTKSTHKPEDEFI